MPIDTEGTYDIHGVRPTSHIPSSLLDKARKRNPRIYGREEKPSSSLATQRTFIDEPRSYVVMNSGTDAVKIDSQGYIVWVPPRDSIMPKMDPPAYHATSFVDPATGEYVPGTVVVSDRFVTGEFGEKTIGFDVVRMIKDWLGPDLVSGHLAKRGLSVMPLDASRDMMEAIYKEGTSRWQTHRIEVAKEAIRVEQSRVDKHKKLGLPPPVPSPDVEEMALFLQEIAAQQRQRISDILASEPPPEVPSDVTKAVGARIGTAPGGIPTNPKTKRDELLDALKADPELRKLIVSAARDMETRSAKAQEIIQQGVKADGEKPPGPVEDEPAEPEQEEPPSSAPEPGEESAPAERVEKDPETGENVIRRRGHPSQFHEPRPDTHKNRNQKQG